MAWIGGDRLCQEGALHVGGDGVDGEDVERLVGGEDAVDYQLVVRGFVIRGQADDGRRQSKDTSPAAFALSIQLGRLRSTWSWSIRRARTRSRPAESNKRTLCTNAMEATEEPRRREGQQNADRSDHGRDAVDTTTQDKAS